MFKNVDKLKVSLLNICSWGMKNISVISVEHHGCFLGGNNEIFDLKCSIGSLSNKLKFCEVTSKLSLHDQWGVRETCESLLKRYFIFYCIEGGYSRYYVQYISYWGI